MKQRSSVSAFTTLSLLCGTVVAHAHPGHYHPEEDQIDEFESFFSGVAHPLTGLDHLVAALAVGYLAFMMGKRLGLVASALFMGMLALGSVIGRSGFAVPMLEQGLALSVVAMGAVLMLNQKASTMIRFLVVAAIGFWHGNAHGMEMPNAVFGAGLWLGTLNVVVLGTLSAWLFSLWTPRAAPFAGAAAALTGLLLCGSRLL